jgi:hypothetical protein
VRQVRHEPIGARCGRGGRRSEGGGERWRGRGFRGGRGGGFGDVALLLPRPGVGMAAVVGGLRLLGGRRGRHGWIGGRFARRICRVAARTTWLDRVAAQETTWLKGEGKGASSGGHGRISGER